MSNALSHKDRLHLANTQYRKSVRLTLVMAVLAAISVVSHFVPVLGAGPGMFPWWMTAVTVLLFGFTVMLALSSKATRDEVAKSEQATAQDTVSG